MKRTTIVLALALAVAIGGSLIAATDRPGPETAFGFEVDLAPLGPGQEGYRCQATFRDLATDEILAAPTVVFVKGSEARTQSEIAETGQLAVLTVQVSATGTATYELEVQEGERLVGRHRATVALDS